MRTRIQLAAAILAVSAVALFTGCTTVKNEQSLESKSKAVAYIATVKVLEEKPQWQPHFEHARDDLKIILAAETIGLPEVLAIVQRLPIKELKGNDATLIIGASMIFFEDDLGTLAIDNPTWLRAVCRGLIAGITLGLPKP